MTTDANVVVWEELDFGHVKPLRTASLTSSHQGSSLHLVREKGGYSVRVWASLTSAFLPEGYPDSVTRDYLPFQFWDTLQGLSTYIRSMLSTKALLSGIGVGQTTATVMGATFQWFLRDFTGMLGGVLFTIYQGSNLDSKAKQWRLVADFMNDIGMLLDLISPLFPSLFMTLLCVGSLARSVTGVASGATRAALTQHFALEQNAADISAKEGSQETAATLSGMLLGLLLAHATSGHPLAIWICFLALTGFHMFANYKAVRCLCLTSLNKERAKIALQTYFVTGKVLSPDDVSRQEVVLPQISSIRQLGQDFFHDQNIILGARISSLGVPGGWKNFDQLVHRFSKENYLLVTEEKKISVVLHRHAKKEDFLKAYVQALVTAIFMKKFGSIREADMHSGDWMEKSYPTFMSELQDRGWNLNRVHVFPDSWRAEWHTSELKSE